MLKATIQITGRTTTDLESALKEALSKLESGLTLAYDCNEDGNYDLKVSGDDADYAVEYKVGDEVFDTYATERELDTATDIYNKFSGLEPIDIEDIRELDGGEVINRIFTLAYANGFEVEKAQ